MDLEGLTGRSGGAIKGLENKKPKSEQMPGPKLSHIGLELTVSSVRSFLAPASGSSSCPALGLSPQIQGKCKSALNLSHYGLRQHAESALKPYGREGTKTLDIRYRVLF